MSLQQILARLARFARSESSSWEHQEGDRFSDELRRAEELIAAEKRRDQDEAVRARERAHAASERNREFDGACRTLGVPVTATFTEISAAYRREISMVHPDRHTGEGGSEAQQREAAIRTLELNRAYTFLKGHFNG